MKRVRYPLTALALACIGGAAAAQITPVGPFVGDKSDGFETQAAFQFDPCVVPDVFQGTGQLCDSGGTAAHVTSGWGFVCTIFPHSGSRLTGSANQYYIYTFNQDVFQFGGYFGSHSGAANATMNFYDASNALIGTQTATIPADCSWNWNGWSSTVGIRKIDVIGNYPGGGFVLMDDMEIKLGGGCGGNSATYGCNAKLSSNGCLPALSASPGAASIGNPTAWSSSTANMEDNKNAITFFGTTGPNNAPFQGGSLCVKAPLYRLNVKNTGGSALCSGAISYNFADYLAHPSGGPILAGMAGSKFHHQTWGRDPGDPFTTQLSNGLETPICP